MSEKDYEYPPNTIYDNTIHIVGRKTDPLRTLIHRTLATTLANSIIGVQPMTAPTGQIFSLRSKYSGAVPNTTQIIKDEIDE